MALCSDAKIEGGVYGDPTEIALIELAQSLGMPKSELEKEYPRVDELPFDSVRKMMPTAHSEKGKTLVFTKGAMDQILKRSDRILVGGKVRKITEEDKKAIMAASSEMSSDALRVLALSYDYKDKPEEENLIFIGLTGMVDPPREAAKPAVVTLKKAGITTIMITGDHKDTAFAIARELGIAKSEEQVMTGDGVNDAPSLKAADIGIAMGITGTDVAKGAADMVLADDNFASIEKAVEEGRGIYANIKKTILFLLSSNIGEVVSMFVAACFGFPSSLIAIHLLWVNLITDSLPAVALGADKKPEDIMNEKPRDAKESLFSHGGYAVTFGYGIWIGLATLIAFLVNPIQALAGQAISIQAIIDYFAADQAALETSQAMAFCVLSFSELFHMLGMVNLKKSFVCVFKDKNLLLWISFILGFALQFFVIFTPGVNTVFKIVPPQGVDWIWVFALSISPLLIHEIAALILFLKKKLSKAK